MESIAARGAFGVFAICRRMVVLTTIVVGDDAAHNHVQSDLDRGDGRTILGVPG